MENAPSHVLIVEDQEENRLLLGTICKRLGLGVIEAEDGIEGLERFSSDPKPDLVFMDIRMPRMDGYACIEKIRELDTETPIVVITAEPEAMVKSKISEEKVNFIVTKPFRLKDINTLLTERFPLKT
jgi:CheY-like chemotaxis protein